MVNNPKIIITCTSPRADDFVSDLQNYNIHTRPALCVEKTSHNIPEGTYDVMLLSSRHAIIDNLPKLPTIAVGKKTATLAKEKNINIIETGNGGVNDLNLTNYKSVLYPCAVEPTDIPPNCTPWPVYETIQNSNFTINNDDEYICVFSIKAANIIKNYNLSNKTILCLSQNIADLFPRETIRKLAVCMHPRYDDMISLILKEIKAHT